MAYRPQAPAAPPKATKKKVHFFKPILMFSHWMVFQLAFMRKIDRSV